MSRATCKAILNDDTVGEIKGLIRKIRQFDMLLHMSGGGKNVNRFIDSATGYDNQIQQFVARLTQEYKELNDEFANAID